MFRTTSAPARRPRPAAILLVVLIMLALFAVIGLSFVLYAESEANAARIHKESVNREAAVNTSDAVNGFLGQLIYQQNVTDSALYGHELSRLIYGNALIVPGNSSAYNGVGVYAETLNLQALGTGVPPAATAPTLHRTQVVRFGPYAPDPTDPTKFVSIDPDLTYAQNGFVDQGGPNAVPTPGGAAKKYVGRNAPYTYPDRNNIAVGVLDAATGRVVKPSFHAPTLFGSLAAVNANWYTPQGYFQLLRPRTIDNLTTAEMADVRAALGLPANQWIPANLTPAQITTLTNTLAGFTRAFPFPAPNADGTVTGDVQNVKFGEGQQENDSVWIDPKLPLITYKGRRLRPLVAATVLAMDGRVNTNVAGNMAAASNAHGSNQGFGPAEVSLSKVLAAAGLPALAQQLVQQRYGTAMLPPSPVNSTRATYLFDPDRFRNATDAPVDTGHAEYPPLYSRIDFNGDGANAPMAAAGVGGYAPATATGPGAFSTSLTYPNATFGNSISGQESQPPIFFSPYHWNPLTTSGAVTAGTPVIGHQFPLGDARYLNARYSDKAGYLRGFTYLGGQDTATPPASFAATTPQHPMNRGRALLTPVSNRLARTGLAPMYLGNAIPAAGRPANNVRTLSLSLNPGALAPVLADPIAPTAPRPGPAFDLAPLAPLAQNASLTPPAENSRLGGDIVSSPNAVAANLAALLQGVDVNRPLRDYRDPATRPTLPLPPGSPPGTLPPVDPNQNWPMAPTTITAATAAAATADRQRLATDIFRRLAVALNARVYFDEVVGLVLPTPDGAGNYNLTVPPGSPQAGLTWTVTAAEYAALRWVAQLSVNAVDAIDGDDISTPFPWNPILPAPAPPAPDPTYNPGPGGLTDRVVFGVEKPKLVINEAYAEVANKQTDYTSSPSATDPNFEARFWAELLNTSKQEYSNTPSGATPAADQSPRNGGFTPLQFPNALAPTLPPGLAPFSSYRLRVYDNGIEVHRQLTQPAATGNPLGAINLTPTPAVPIALKLDMQFDAALTTDAGVPQNTGLVEPNNGAFAANATAGQRNGFCVVGPNIDPATTESAPTAYAPKTNDTNSPDRFMLLKPAGGTPADALAYDVSNQSGGMPVEPDQIPAQIVNPLNERGHAVVLQRLANPYLPPNDPTVPAPAYNPALPYNPYITVDFMADIKVNDAIRVGPDPDGPGAMNPKNGDRSATAMPTPARPDANFALGRCQPFAGYQQVTTAPGGTTPFFTSQVPNQPPALPAAPFMFPPAPLGQTLAVPMNPQPAPPDTEPRQTFFRHNSMQAPMAVTPNLTMQAPPAGLVETLTVPFHEPRTPDRKFVSPLELLHVAAVPPHLLTHEFARPSGSTPAGAPIVGGQELVAAMVPLSGAPEMRPPLYRALEVLNLKPWTYGLPHAGQVPGGINVNMIWDEVYRSGGTPELGHVGDSTVFQALLDAQPANSFADPELQLIWQRLRKSRSPNWEPAATPAPASGDPVPPVVGVTVDEIDPTTGQPGTDRPFKGYGVGQFETDPTRAPSSGLLNLPTGLPNVPTPSPHANGHGLQSTLLRTGPDGQPLFALRPTSGPTDRRAEPYFQYEPLRKASNNLSTTSDTFLVVFTVGFFDMTEEGNRVVLRREAFDQVPGDLREQFTALIDRSGLAVPATAGGNATGKFAQTVAATELKRLPDSPAVSGRRYRRYLLRFPAAGSDGTAIAVRDNPTANGSTFTVQVGSTIRLGDGPNADNLVVGEVGGGYNYNNTPAAPAGEVSYPPFDAATGLAAVVAFVEIDTAGNPLPAGAIFPRDHAAGELISLPDNEFSNPATAQVFVPGNPGAVFGFSPADPRYRGVVRYFGRLIP